MMRMMTMSGMTREEAIKNIKDILEEATQYEHAVCYVTSVDEEPLKIAIADMEKQINCGLALDLAWRYGQVGGEHHKMWVIDQMVRMLCGSEEEYAKWVSKYTEPLEDGDYYEWDCGIAP